MKRKTRMLCLMLALVLMLSALSGCRLKHYERSEIVEWAQENIDRSVTVSDEYFTRPSSDEGYTDRVWTAHTDSLPGLEFEIISHQYYGMESVTHSIESTYWHDFGEYYFKEYLSGHYTDIVPLEEEWNTGRFRLLATFKDRYGLTDIIAQAKAIEEYMCAQGCVEFVSFKFEYDDVLAQVDDTDVFEYATGLESLDSIGDILLDEFMLYAADYRLALDQFTQEEIEQAVSSSDQRFYVTRADGSVVSYSDLALSCYGYGMSFGSLYEVLTREGFDTDGSPEYFSVVGIDGSVYEFSYSFNDMPFENGKNGYYYIKNGEKTAMDYYFYNHIRSRLFEEISGMRFDDAD